jgi:hypothetical protein
MADTVKQSNDHSQRKQRALFTCDATTAFPACSHSCIEHTTVTPDSQWSILYCNIKHTHHITAHLKYYTQKKYHHGELAILESAIRNNLEAYRPVSIIRIYLSIRR